MNRLAIAVLALFPAVAGAEDSREPTAPEVEASGPVTYDLSPSSGRLYVLVRYKRGTLASGFGHDHVVAASGWSGQVTWDASNLTACDVQIDVPVSGLVVDPGDARDWEGLDGETSDADKATITENMRSDDQLDIDQFPTIRYQSSSCAAGESGLTNVTGTLTIHGVGHTVTVPMRIRHGDGTFGASGEFTASHDDFGMDPYRAAFGALKNDETLKFVIDVSGSAR